MRGERGYSTRESWPVAGIQVFSIESSGSDQARHPFRRHLVALSRAESPFSFACGRSYPPIGRRDSLTSRVFAHETEATDSAIQFRAGSNVQIIKKNAGQRRTPGYYRLIGALTTVSVTTGSWVLILVLVAYFFDFQISVGFTTVFALMIAAISFIIVAIFVGGAGSRRGMGGT